MAEQLQQSSVRRGTPNRDRAIRPTPMSSSAGRVKLTHYLVRRLLCWIGNPPITVVLWDGSEIAPSDGSSAPRLHLRDRRTLWKLCINPLFEFGEAYSRGDIEVDGDLTKLIASIFSAYNELPRNRASQRTRAPRWLSRSRHEALLRSRHNVHHHYDIGNDFYKLWLDDQMVYTCAYFADSPMTLEEAQIAKMEHVCRKLRLKAGETVLEAGCGWGALALHMARHYDVHVKAFNVSHDQIRYARHRARHEKLSGQVEFVDDDWRNIDEPCDAFVSVGMLEHVGAFNYRELGDVIDRCLTKQGRGLIHSIGQNCPQPFSTWTERRIFPGAYPPALSEMMDIFEPHHFSVLDVENLRLHYGRTLRCWLDQYEHSSDRIRQMFDDRFVRMWRLYLSASIAAFEVGSLQLFQIVFARADNNAIPWTRDHLSVAEWDDSLTVKRPKHEDI